MSKSSIYVGIDLHKRKFTYVKSASGKEMGRGTRPTDQESIAEFASGFIPRHQDRWPTAFN